MCPKFGGGEEDSALTSELTAPWWALKDLNLRPTDYESVALTTELRALNDSLEYTPSTQRSGSGLGSVFGDSELLTLNSELLYSMPQSM